jgi:hypothetical protein
MLINQKRIFLFILNMKIDKRLISLPQSVEKIQKIFIKKKQSTQQITRYIYRHFRIDIKNQLRYSPNKLMMQPLNPFLN